MNATPNTTTSQVCHAGNRTPLGKCALIPALRSSVWLGLLISVPLFGIQTGTGGTTNHRDTPPNVSQLHPVAQHTSRTQETHPFPNKIPASGLGRTEGRQDGCLDAKRKQGTILLTLLVGLAAAVAPASLLGDMVCRGRISEEAAMKILLWQCIPWAVATLVVTTYLASILGS